MLNYQRLQRYLASQAGDTIELSFREIEDILAQTPPMQAREYRASWGNENPVSWAHVQSRAWQTAGWKVDYVDSARGVVRFVRR